MASSPVYEGDTIILFCPEAKGFLYSQPPSSSYTHVTVFQVATPQSLAFLKDPAFPNVHFASFQVLPENSNLDLENYSPLGGHSTENNSLPRSLVYGRKVKLLHVASKKYLSIKPSDKSGSINPVAQLLNKDDGYCLFRILPSRTGKQRGEDVNSADSIKLECVSKKNHHLLCAPNTLTSRYELKMAVTDSTFLVYSQTTGQREAYHHKALRGGDVLMLFNIKREAYVAGRGSIATEYLPGPIREDKVKEVGARGRQAVRGIQKAPPVSGDCFWQFESTDNPLSNDQFKYNDKCRIKHLPTQQYLAVEQKGGIHLLTLKQLSAGLRNDSDVTFSLISVKGSTGGIRKGSYVELRHIGTGKNLTAQTKSYLQHQTSDPDEETSSKKWYKLVLEDSDESKQQFFRLEEVKEDLIHEYYHISGVVAVLREYIQKFTAAESEKSTQFPPVLDELIEVLHKLAEWIVGSFENQKSRANMLRVAEGVDLLVGFLHEITDYTNQELFHLCRYVCLVLKRYVEGGNRKSHLYLAEKRLMDTLFSRIGCNLGVERVLSTLVRDESDLTGDIVSRLTTDPVHTENILEKLDASTLDFLSSLCFTSGKPSRHLQNIMCNYVIKSEKIVLFRTTIVNDVEVHFTHPERLDGRPVLDICSQSNDAQNKKDFDFLIAQLKLFSRVCKGVNFSSINLITKKMKYTTFQQALFCINDTKIHPLLRSAYLDFVISAFVEYNVEESGTDIDNIWHSFFWDRICPNPMDAASMGDTFAAIPNAKEIRALQKSIRTFLTQSKVLYAEEQVEGHNELLTVMLSVMEPLVSYGFYWKTEETIEIVNCLMDLLNGVTDRPKQGASPLDNTAFQTKDRYKSNEKNRAIFKVKTKAVQVLHLFFKQLSYMALAKVIYDFKFLSANLEASSADNYSPINEGLAMLLQDDFELNNDNSNLAKLASERLRYYYTESAYPFFDFCKGEGENLIKILMDLMKYENDELRLNSTQLLFDIFQEENILFADAQKSYIVTIASGKPYSRMLGPGCLSDEKKTLLRMMQGTAISGDTNEALVSLLEYVCSVCIVDDDETVPNCSSQWIAYSTGVFQALLTYVLSYSLGENESQQKLLELVCKTLQRIIRGNPQIQAKLFASFVDLIDAKTAVTAVAQLLTETVTDSLYLCRLLSEADIRQMFYAANTDVEYCEFFTTLEAVIKVSKSMPNVLRKHQDVVGHVFTEIIPESFRPMLTSSGQKNRHAILSEKEDTDISVVQLLSTCDLLATCCEGQCQYAENMCQGIFTLEELISILIDKSIPCQRKKPFARILHWTYLSTERNSLTALSYASKNEEFWAHIEECALYMQSLCRKIQEGYPDSNTVNLLLKVLLTRHMSIQAWLKHSSEINVPVSLRPMEPEDDDDDEQAESEEETIPMNCFLLYMCDGIIPLITSFCHQLEIQNSSGLTSKIYTSLLTPKVISVLKTISESLAQLVMQLPEVFLTSANHVNLFNGCLESLVFVLPSQDSRSLNQARETVLSIGEEFFQSHGVIAFHQRLGEELEKNNNFRVFIKNFEVAYQGDTKFLVSQATLGSNDFLPHGASFKKLVSVFSADSTLFRSDQTIKLEKVRNLLRIVDILYRQLQQPLTGRERAAYDFMLLTTLQVLSGVVLTQIEGIDQNLQSENPEQFEEEYTAKVKPIQDRLVKMKSYEKVMVHLSHPKDEVAVQVLGFLRVILYLGNTEAQKSIGHLTGHQNTKFFIRISQLLDSVISSLGRPLTRAAHKPTSAPVKKKVSPPPPPTAAPVATDEQETREPSASAQVVQFAGLEEDPLTLHQENIELADLSKDQGEVEIEEGDKEKPSEERKHLFQSRAASDSFFKSISVNEDDVEESLRYRNLLLQLEDINLDDEDYYEDEDEYDDEDYYEDEDYDEYEEEEDEFDYGDQERRVVRKYSVVGAGQLETSTDDALKRASIVLDVVSWLCDGQNREMQDILRQQGFTFSNVNIVAEIAVLLQTLAEHLSIKNLSITRKAIQALIEMCAGNYTNQETAFKGQIVDSINTILQYSLRRSTEEETAQVLDVRASAIELLEVMLEETHEKSPELAQGISDDLSVLILLNAMLEITDHGEKIESVHAKTERAVFRGYHVLKKISDYLNKSLDSYVESKYPKFLVKNEKAEAMWLHLGNWSRSIEVNYETKDGEEILTKVHFPFNPAKELSEADKDIVKDNIVRESPDDKVKDLLEWMESIRKNIRHKTYIASKPWLKWTTSFSGTRHLALMFLTLLLNILVLALFEVPDNLTNANDSNASVILITEPHTPKWFSSYLLFILGIFHLILGIWMIIEYFVLEAKNILVSFPLLEKLLWDLKKWVYKREHLKNLCVEINKAFCGNSITINPPGEAKCFEVYLLSFAPLYRIFFVVCSILALGTHGYFYCGCSLYLFLKSSVLHQVLTAVRRSALQLITVGLLAVAVLLIYAVISFSILHNFFDPEENLYCNTLWQCFVTVSREGLLDTLGATLPVIVREEGKSPTTSFTIYATRTIFDLTFFIIVTTLGLNIVVAILVDRFSELRSEKDEIKKDKLNYCFICGIDNDTFERKAKGFRHHVQNDHSKWNYIYFVLHLDSLYTNDHNALEKYVFDNIQARKIGFFPVRKAKVLGGRVDSGGQK